MVICRNNMSRQKMILPEILLLHMILLDCFYFIGSNMTISKLKGRIFGPFTVGHWLGISLQLQTPCTDKQLDMLEPNIHV